MSWTGKVERGTYFVEPWSDYTPAVPVPEWLNWDLWHGPLTSKLPYSEDLTPRRWRAFWETGGGQLADWGCHLLDLLYFAYDLPSPEAVLTDTIKPVGHRPHGAQPQHDYFRRRRGKFAREKFVLHYNDSALLPSFAALGLPEMQSWAPNHTMVVCEEGTLLLQADGKITIYRKGRSWRMNRCRKSSRAIIGRIGRTTASGRTSRSGRRSKSAGASPSPRCSR